MSIEKVLSCKRSAPANLNEKARLNLSGSGGFYYAFRTMRMNSVTKSNAIKSLIVMSNAPSQGLRLTAYRIDSTYNDYTTQDSAMLSFFVQQKYEVVTVEV